MRKSLRPSGYYMCLVCIPLVLACGRSRSIEPVAAQAQEPDAVFKSLDMAWSNIKSEKDITVDSAVAFRIGDVRCQLLGLKEVDNVDVRAKAVQFTGAWLKHYYNHHFAVYNDEKPLVIGPVAVVWIRGFDCNLSCLNSQLVQAGFAEIDIDRPQWREYSFSNQGKGRRYVEDWINILRNAKENREKGVKPDLFFDWPEKAPNDFVPPAPKEDKPEKVPHDSVPPVPKADQPIQ